MARVNFERECFSDRAKGILYKAHSRLPANAVPLEDFSQDVRLIFMSMSVPKLPKDCDSEMFYRSFAATAKIVRQRTMRLALDEPTSPIYEHDDVQEHADQLDDVDSLSVEQQAHNNRMAELQAQAERELLALFHGKLPSANAAPHHTAKSRRTATTRTKSPGPTARKAKHSGAQVERQASTKTTRTAIGEKLIAIRKTLGMTREEFMTELGVLLPSERDAFIRVTRRQVTQGPAFLAAAEALLAKQEGRRLELEKQKARFDGDMGGIVRGWATDLGVDPATVKGVEALRSALRVHPSTLYRLLNGSRKPKLERIMELQNNVDAHLARQRIRKA